MLGDDHVARHIWYGWLATLADSDAQNQTNTGFRSIFLVLPRSSRDFPYPVRILIAADEMNIKNICNRPVILYSS